MQQVRCTNCGSAAIVPDESGEFCKCEACGSTFNVPKATAFSKVELDHTQDIRAWREYLYKQLRLQQESSKARDYGGVKLFSQKILSVLPDDFCALYYLALAERYEDNDTAYADFLHNADLVGVTPDELKEVTDSLVATVEPKYLDDVKAFIARAYPETHSNYDVALDRNVKNYIQKLHYTNTQDRDVFICHRTAAPDQDIADAICTRLEERGLRCWIAPRNILAGSQNYERDIIKGVENCRIFLVISSFKSIYSEDCEMELKAAVLADKALYSYRIDNTEYDGAFKKALSPVQWLDATDDPYAHLEQLVIDIKGMLAEDEREKAELEEKRLAAREKERLIAEDMRSRERERLDRLERMMSGDAVAAPNTYNYRSRLKRAEIEVNSGNFERVESIADEVLDCDPENALAWWLLLLCDYRVTTDKALADTGEDFTVNANFKNAERFSDAMFKKRIDAAVDLYRVRAIKEIDDALDEAEEQFSREDYAALKRTLGGCARAFYNEDGLIFKKFPDVAARYFWLKLWSKYEQTPLVCVEDITRESEYKSAIKYASPAQLIEFDRARVTVAKNAQLFLRERSKNRANDGKLVDYLVDNKNILPVETYNYYSSLLYYRKMLSQLNMTESQLRSSTVDISTNEYFMLACSLATEAQKIQYNELAATLDANRENKFMREKEEHDKKAAAIKREQNKTKILGTSKTLAITMSAIVSYVIFAVGVALFILDFDDDVVNDLFIASAVFRIVNEIAVLLSMEKKLAVAIVPFNIIASIVSIIMMASESGSSAVSVIAMVLGIIILVKYGKSRNGGN